MLNHSDIMSTVDMIDHQHLDIRTITMGISLLDCADPDPAACARKIHDKICRQAEHLVQTGCQIERELGIPIVNDRIYPVHYPEALTQAMQEEEYRHPLQLVAKSIRFTDPFTGETRHFESEYSVDFGSVMHI